MNGSQVEECLRVMEEMIMEEGKMVTFKLLSRTLGLNVNAAKQLLHIYLVKQKKITECKVAATHLLAGLSKDGTFLVSIINENKLHEAYAKYDKITSEHIYSIHKGEGSGIEKNSQMIFVADSSLPSPKSHSIKYHKILEESTVDRPMKTTGQSAQVKAEAESDETVKEKKGNEQSPGRVENPTTKKPCHISNFFNNQCQRKKVKQEKAESEIETAETEQTPKNIVESNFPEISISQIPGEEKKKETSTISRKPEKKTGIKKEKKKRKRILSASEDSESDEEKRDALLCVEPPAPDTCEPLRITDDEDDLFENKRKRKKVVDKTVLREDGFMETYKEVIYETDSDDESPKQKKKEAKMSRDCITSGSNVDKIEKEESASKRVKAPAQKSANCKKQSTLFSFFKKN